MDDLINKSDEEIVELSIGNSDYFSHIIKRYKDKLRRYIRRLTSASDDNTDDILQDVFIKAYINIKSFDPSLKFSSWIYRIAHNEAISFYRKKKKHDDTFLYDEEIIENISDEIDIEKEYIDLEFQKSFTEAINDLDEKYRNVIILKFIEGKDYDEISDIIKKPPGTVATWINRGKEKLKEIVKEKGLKRHE